MSEIPARPGAKLWQLGDVTRFKIEGGMYWFFAAVFLSLVNAHWTAKRRYG